MSFLNTYAKRQLNPFEGVLQIAESAQARAFSVNGRIWQIQVLTHRPEHTWRSADTNPPSQQFFNWGLWSEEKGMQQVNANPILDLGAMTKASDDLLDALRKTQLPYVLKDRFEYWACDADHQPIALLSSATSKPQRDFQPKSHFWSACRQNDERLHKSDLQAQVALMTGYLQGQFGQYRWFERTEDGNAIRLDNLQRLTAENFPELLLRENYADPSVNSAIKDYLDWLSPLLLTLPLSNQHRSQLETMACQQHATLVAELYRVYPKIIHPELVQKARVEATIRNKGRR